MTKIDYSQRPEGTSKREWTAQQTGGTLNYKTGEIVSGNKPSIYSGENILSAVSNPVSKPDYSAVENINSSLQKSLEALNEYDLNMEKTQAKIENQKGLGLIPMGRQANEAARIGAIGRTGLANVVEAKTGAVNAAKDAYKMYIDQYNTDREFSLKEKELSRGSSSERLGKITVEAENSLMQAKGEDGFSDPNVYRSQRQAYIAQGGSMADFDAQFSGYLSDQEKANLKIKEISNLTPKQQTVVGQISGQFDNEPVVKEYNTLQQQKVFINNLDNNTNNPADDQAVIYAFAKVMDPNSVVREGEYKTVSEYSQALLQRFGYTAKRVFDNSGFLAPEARQFLKATLNQRISANEKSYQNIFNEYGRRIEDLAGVKNGQTYLTNYGGGYEQKQSKPQQMNLNGQVYILGEDGNYYSQ